MSTLLQTNGTQRNLNFVHPPDPPLVKYLLLVLMLVCGYSAKSQVRELPVLDSLENSLKVHYNQLWQADREQFNISQKGKWLNYVPSVGITLGMPSVSYSTQQMYAYLDNKRSRAAAIKSIEYKYTLQYNEELNKLRIEYEKLKLQKHKLELQQRSILTDRKIFAIHQEAYNKKELKPLDYLIKLKSMEDIEGIVSITEQDYSIGILELLKLARYGVKQYAIWFEVEECIMLADSKEVVK